MAQAFPWQGLLICPDFLCFFAGLPHYGPEFRRKFGGG
jgi:hypothetical protein